MEDFSKQRYFMVYFELLGMKMKAKVFASDEQQIKEEMLKIFSIEYLKSDKFNQTLDALDHAVDILEI